MNTPAVQAQRLPDVPPWATLDTLGLRAKTLNRLRPLGIGTAGRRLSQFTVADLQRLPAFGSRSLLDLLACLERSYRRRRPQKDPDAEQCPAGDLADRLESSLGGWKVDEDDPRLGALLRDAGFRSTGRLLRHLRRRSAIPSELADDVQTLIEKVERLSHLTLEAEAVAMLARWYHSRTRVEELVRAYYGFGRPPAATLKELGEQCQLTRERIRQICSPTWLKRQGPRLYLPRFRTVWQMVQRQTSRPSVEIEAELRQAGLIERGTRVFGIIRYARALGYRGVTETRDAGQGVVVPVSERGMAGAVRRKARYLAGLHGGTTAQRVSQRLRERRKALRITEAYVEQALRCDRALIAVDGNPAWFVRRGRAHPLFRRRILSLLAVAGRLTAPQIAAALGRIQDSGSWVPPPHVLRVALETIREIRFEGEAVVPVEPIHLRILPRHTVAGWVVRMLASAGGMMNSLTLGARAEAAGIKTPALWAVLVQSPLVHRVGRGVYALIGSGPSAEVDPPDQACSGL
ncbi:MAG: hypothetical protein HY718_13270 [Planctomycetes bacterium]|nr:hypothetical protein [Planctomycetota bacterium]